MEKYLCWTGWGNTGLLLHDREMLAREQEEEEKVEARRKARWNIRGEDLGMVITTSENTSVRRRSSSPIYLYGSRDSPPNGGVIAARVPLDASQKSINNCVTFIHEHPERLHLQPSYDQ